MTVGDLKVTLKLSMAGFKAQLSQAKTALNSFQKATKKAGSIMGNVWTKGMSIIRQYGLVVAAAVTGSIVAFARFEDRINRTAVIIGKGTKIAGKDFDALRSRAIQLGRDTLFTATQTAEGMQVLAKAGLTTAEVMETVDDAINLAIAGEVDMASASRAVVATMKQFSLEVGDAGKITDMLAVAANSSLASIQGLADSMKYTGAISSVMGNSLEDTLAIVAAGADAGYEASQMGTSLRMAFARLAKGIPSVTASLDAMGIKVEDGKGKMKPMIDILDDMQKAAKKNGFSLKFLGDLMKVVGVRAGGPFASLLQRGSQSIVELRDAIKDSTGASYTMAEAFRDTVKGRTMDLIASIDTLNTVLHLGLDGAIKNVIYGIRNWTVALTEILVKNDKLKTILAGVKTGLQPLKKLFTDAGQAFLTWVENIDPKTLGDQLQQIFKDISDSVVSFSTYLSSIPWGDVLKATGTLLNLLLKIELALAKIVALSSKLPAITPFGLGRAMGEKVRGAFSGGSKEGGSRRGAADGGIFENMQIAASSIPQTVKDAILKQTTSMEEMASTVEESQVATSTQLATTGNQIAGSISTQGTIVGTTLTNIGHETSSSLKHIEEAALKYGRINTAALLSLQNGYAKLNAEMANVKSRMQRTSQKGSK